MDRVQIEERGAILPFLAVSLSVLLVAAAFAIDYGYFYFVLARLQSAADAAALAAAQDLPQESVARSRAIEYAEKNLLPASHGRVLRAADVEIGTWDASRRTFNPGGAVKNAVRVTVRRAQSNGNPAAFLLAAGLLGHQRADLAATATAVLQNPCRHSAAIIGLDRVTMSGTSYTDSYRGSYSAATRRRNGAVCSNGFIGGGAGTEINGNASPGIGEAVLGTVRVSGTIRNLDVPLVLPKMEAGELARINDNHRIPVTANGIRPLRADGSLRVEYNDTLRLPPGRYYFTTVVISSGSTLEISGPTFFYVEGNYYANGASVVNPGGNPNDFALIANGTIVGLSGSTDLYGIVYAPFARVSRTSVTQFFGTVAGKEVAMSGYGGIHFYEDIRHPIPELNQLTTLVD